MKGASVHALGAPCIILIGLLNVSNDVCAQPGHAFAKIVGGSNSAPGQWRDVAGVRSGGSYPNCTGVLIAPRVVLTAGHCLQVGVPLSVVLDTTDLASPGEQIDIVDMVAYPDSFQNFDVGLLFLGHNALATPRAIAQGCALDYLMDGAIGTIAGWGAVDMNGNSYVSALREAFVPIRHAACTDLSLGCNENAFPDGEIVAGGDGIDACYGDDGAPLYLTTPVGVFLAGVASRAEWNAYPSPCGGGTIYVRPDAVLPWIEQETGLAFPPPDCGNVPLRIFAAGFE